MPAINDAPVALVTGAAHRIGACIASHLHQCNFRVVIHFNHSANDAKNLCQKLNKNRADSAVAVGADLQEILSVRELARVSINHWGRLDALINNASSFFPTPWQDASEDQWHELINSNLQGPYFLCQATGEELIHRAGSIINISDIYATQPLPGHSIYCIAKAGNVMLTRSMARELAPRVRVNGIAPGVILWPENNPQENVDNDAEKNRNHILRNIPLPRMGSPQDIASAVEFLLCRASYVTGQTISVDGGKHLVV